MTDEIHRTPLTMREIVAIRLILLALRIVEPMYFRHILEDELDSIRAALR